MIITNLLFIVFITSKCVINGKPPTAISSMKITKTMKIKINDSLLYVVCRHRPE